MILKQESRREENELREEEEEEEEERTPFILVFQVCAFFTQRTNTSHTKEIRQRRKLRS